MKFRHHSVSWRVSRRIGRGIARAIPDEYLIPSTIIAFILAVLAGSPILILVAFGLLILIVPAILILASIVLGGMFLIYAVRNHYPQIILSWFFLKEDEPDGTILPIGEIKNRFEEFLR